MIISTLVNNIRSEDHVFLSILACKKHKPSLPKSRELLIGETRHIFRKLSRAKNESKTIFIEIHADCRPRLVHDSRNFAAQSLSMSNQTSRWQIFAACA